MFVIIIELCVQDIIMFAILARDLRDYIIVILIRDLMSVFQNYIGSLFVYYIERLLR